MSCDSALFSCFCSIWSKYNTITGSDNIGNIIFWPVGINESFLVPKLVDGMFVAQNNYISWTKLQRIDSPVLFTPSFESVSAVLSLAVDVGEDGETTYCLYKPVVGT